MSVSSVMEVSEQVSESRIAGVLHTPSGTAERAIGLTHGAGGNCNGALLIALAEKLAASGWLVLRYDLPFRQARPSAPPHPAQAAKDRDGIRAVARFLKERAGQVVLGGQSYGGRQATMAAAETPDLADALLLLSYPLHPPGKPDQLRTEHLSKLAVPCCFVQGTRDPFATPEEIGQAIRTIPRAELRLLEKAGHSLPPASASQIAEWLNDFLR